MTIKKIKNILDTFIYTVLILFFIGYVCLIYVYLKNMPKNETMKKFTKHEIELFEKEFGFKLEDNEYISMAKCITVHSDFRLQIWVKQISSYKNFVIKNLKMSIHDFQISKIELYSKRGRIWFNDKGEGDKGTIDGFENIIKEDELGFAEEAIEFYQEESDNFYTAIFYKSSNIHNKEILEMFY